MLIPCLASETFTKLKTTVYLLPDEDDSTKGHAVEILANGQQFSVTPKAGDWPLMRRHIREVIAKGNDDDFAYVMSWLSFCVQNPHIPPEVALVLTGGKGTGKGIVGRAMCRIFGQHSMHISNAKHLIGNFNNHLRDCIFLFADEAFFAGDKQHEGTLKSLITEPYITVEAKHRDAIQAPNLLHILMCSNETWVAPASHDERRYAVFAVSNDRQGDRAYFKAIVDQMESGGFEAMLHDLLEYDLSNFEIRDMPHTEGLVDNKLQSLTGADAWLFDILGRGYLHGEPGEHDHRYREVPLYNDSPNTISKTDAFFDFEKNQKQYRAYAMSAALFYKNFYKYRASGLVRESRPSARGGRVASIVLAPLKDARGFFARFMGGSINWDDT